MSRIAPTQQSIARVSRALCGLVSALGVVVALVVIIPCWPQARSAFSLHDVSILWPFRTLADVTCLQSYRWIFLTIVDVATEFLIVGVPLFTFRKIQFRSSSQKWKLALLIMIGRIRSEFEIETTKTIELTFRQCCSAFDQFLHRHATFQSTPFPRPANPGCPR